jgi:hypothetical protein
MTPSQRLGLGRALLEAMWDNDGAATTPSDLVVGTFANGIGTTCATWTDEKVSTVAAGLYLLADDVKP